MARWSDAAKLITFVEPPETTNANGFINPPSEKSRLVFCNKKSVGYSEFYKSQQAGYKTELKLDLHKNDYADEKIVEVDGLRYKVLRSYESKGGDFMELTLTDLSERGETDG